MSQENVELVRPGFAEVGGYPNRIEAAEFARWGSSLKLEPERFLDVDDERVLVFMRVTAEGAESGVPVERRDAHEYTIRDGVCVRVKVYADRTEALEAAGLRE